MTDQTYVGGNSKNNDIQSSSDNGTILFGGAGDDILRGSRGDDILTGGKGNDWMWGGDGGDQFRFFGDGIDGAFDQDKIFDLDFSEGDELVFGHYGVLSFEDSAGLNAFDGGASARISSWQGVVSMVEGSDGHIAVSQKGKTGVLILSIDNGLGQTQEIHITGGWAAYSAAALHPA